MARPIDIPIVSDVREFLRGTQDVESALDDVSSSLDEVSREARDVGDEAGRGLSQGIEDGARDAEQAVDDLADSGRNLDQIGERAEAAFEETEQAAQSASDRIEQDFRSAFDTVKRESSDVGTSTRRGFDDASEGANDFRQEASQTARETAASFDGSAESIGDAFQEVAANAFAGFGPAGAVAGLAAAAGIGAAVSAMEDAKEETEEYREEVSELVGDFADVAFEGESSLQLVIDKMREIAEATGEGETSLADFREQVEGIAGLDFESFAQGLAGDPELLDQSVEQLDRYIERLKEQRDIRDASDIVATRQISNQLSLAEELRGKLVEKEEQATEARKEQEALEAARLKGLQERIEAEEEAAERRQEFLADVRADVAETTDAWQEHFDKVTEDGELSFDELDASLDKMLADQERKQEYWTTANAELTREQMLVMEEFGEQKYQALDELMNQPPDVRQTTLDKMQQAGERMAADQVDGYEEGLPEYIDGPTAVFDMDDSSVEEAKQRIANETVYLQVYAAAGQGKLRMP